MPSRIGSPKSLHIPRTCPICSGPIKRMELDSSKFRAGECTKCGALVVVGSSAAQLVSHQ